MTRIGNSLTAMVACVGALASSVSAVEEASWGQVKEGAAGMTQTAAKTPVGAFARRLISDVTHVHDGLVITLTDEGLRLGRDRAWAQVIADRAVAESEFARRSNWSWFDRMVTWPAMFSQIRTEIWLHAVAYGRNPQPRYRTVNISFGRQ